MIAAQWRTLPTKFPNTQLDEFIVMPNHIHGIIIFVGASLVGAHSNASNSGDKNDIPTKKLGDVIGAYKSLTTVAFVQGVKTLKWPPFSEKLWQRNYYEHIIRNDKDLLSIQQYITDNPARWNEDPDNLQKNYLTCRHPLESFNRRFKSERISYIVTSGAKRMTMRPAGSAKYR